MSAEVIQGAVKDNATNLMRTIPVPGQPKEAAFIKPDNRPASGILISPTVGDNGIWPNRVTTPGSLSKVKPSMQIQPSDKHHETPDTGLSVDQKLVERVQKGDKKAFDLLVIKYQGRVASIVSRYVSDHHDIADVTQETFIKAYRALKGFRGDSAFYTWIYRIAVNCAKNYLASRGRRPPLTDINVDEAEHLSAGQNLSDLASPENLMSKDQLAHVVKNAIMKLPEDLRVALTLREFDGLSYDEISSVMDCPVGTVRSRIFRAREFVDKEIDALTGDKE